MEPTYKKTPEGKLEIKETVEKVREISLEELKAELELRLKNRDLLDERIAEIEKLIVEAGKLGVVEKVEETIEESE